MKPIRYGERHGHRVIVNRQLATANAFEDLLAERLPRFHRRIRAFMMRGLSHCPAYSQAVAG